MDTESKSPYTYPNPTARTRAVAVGSFGGGRELKMTAEVAVMNRMGVALAADSAVTIGSSANKIYTSAEKLFQLAECAPVGVMIYGNAEYVLLPWETIIKAFRRQLGKGTRATVEQYSDEFTTFLRDNPRLFPEVDRLDVAEKLAYSMIGELRRRRNAAVAAKQKERKPDDPPLTPAEIGATFAEVLAEMRKHLQAADRVEGLDDELNESVKARVNDRIATWIKKAFDFELPEGSVENLAAAIVEYLTGQTLQDYTSGIVIAGYGDEEFMPALANFEVEECVGPRPRKAPTGLIRIDRELPAYVMPYAQQDSVIHFLLGVDSDLSEFMRASVEQMGTALIDTILDKVAEA